MNPFDAISKNVFDLCRTNFGYPATWNPSKGGNSVSKTVLYKYPTDKHELDENVSFDVERYSMEFFEGDFPGLIDAVEDRENEQLIIELSTGVFQTFIVKRCQKKFDGKTAVAYLQPL